MSILLQKPGILTTVQDLGRYGYRRFGINPGGAMDQAAARLVNILLDNDDEAAVLEMHFPAPQIVFETDTIAAIGGAEFLPTLDNAPIDAWRPFLAKKSSVLKFSAKTSGTRAYLAVQGGFKADEWLGSASTNLAAKMGGAHGKKLDAGSRVKLNLRSKDLPAITAKAISPSLIPVYRPFPTVRIMPGAEFDHLGESGQRLLLDQDFTISNNSNRMGYRLSGEPITLAKKREFISSAVSFGTVQILPDGQLIVLMADHQTAGGYPRLAHVITHDLPLLAQLGATDKVAFHAVDGLEAEQLSLQFEKELSFLRIACKFQANAWVT